ncbi:iron ABC transporter permease [Aeromicrobium sp. YIM 150415]|uniref:FecCD family ABC transporter permease n=1 Tax=Aeromicrobium sp. YIM 150415 TaxID=2803912 RepID=UPI001965F59A|nr:iron ABC transporter permease [Aeromicrobium sp. YIM 150415]MBM9463791.1 iron ABC transporter permease [Aeromicrobium sp. YIM 150415]
MTITSSETGSPRTAESVRSWRRARSRRERSVGATLILLSLLLVCLASVRGSYDLNVAEVALGAVGIGDPMTVYVVQQLRLPRSAVAFGVGMAFGVSGAVFQSLARNALASPDIIGISTGASFGAVLVIATIGSSAVLVPAAAFGGALVTAAFVTAFSLRSSVSPMRLILVGIGLQATLGAVIGVVLARLDPGRIEQSLRWLSGSISGRGWLHVAGIAGLLLLLAVPLHVGTRPLGVLQLGDQVARSAGVGTRSWQITLIVLACVLCAGGVSVAGPVLLIAFLGPPIARRLIGSPGPALAMSGIVSGTVMVASDLIAREGIGHLSLPVGIVTGLLGAPVLLWVLLRGKGVGHG